MKMVSCTPDEFRRFKRRYEKAVKFSEERFTFKFASEAAPSEFLTAYAKYVIEYLESKIPG